MRKKLSVLLSIMLLCPVIAWPNEQPTILSNLNNTLKLEYLEEFGSPFNPEMTALPMVMEFQGSEYQYAVNENFLRLFNTLVDVTGAIPLNQEVKTNFFDGRTFGIIIGVLGSAVLVWAGSQL